MEVRWIGKVFGIVLIQVFSYLQSFLYYSASESLSGLTKTTENYTQKQPSEMFYKNGVLKNFKKNHQKKPPVAESLF